MGLSRPLPGAAVAALWLTVGASAAEAQSRRAGYAGLVLEAPAGIEAAAFGNAPYLLGGGAELIFYAPALIGRANGMAVGLQRYGSEGTLATLAGTGSVGLGDFTVGLQYLRYTTEGLPRMPDIQWPAVTGEGPPITEFVASLGHARELFASVEVGVVAKYLEYQFVSRTERTTLLDVGVAREFGPTMVSVAARNLGSDLELRGRGLRIPTQLALGISTQRFEVGELDMFLTSQVARRRDGEVIPAGGIEVSYWPVQGYTFRLRAGLQRVVEDERSPFTFGIAFTGDALTLEYAFQAFDVAGNAHRFGLSFR
ncbi:hypothetical protein [Candidatus Palauibacter sp.]|uniref:hypothetical protein n=1 Tax=Candidatus Palauibacter sp. TaxID=3101350 RepID=UPI003B519C9A